jgi:hypothetical protein
VDAVEECRVLKLDGQNLKQVTIAFRRLTKFEVGVDVPAEHDGTRGREFLVTPAELAGLHVVLEHTDARLHIVEPRVGDFIEEHDMLEAHDAELP